GNRSSRSASATPDRRASHHPDRGAQEHAPVARPVGRRQGDPTWPVEHVPGVSMAPGELRACDPRVRRGDGHFGNSRVGVSVTVGSLSSTRTTSIQVGLVPLDAAPAHSILTRAACLVEWGQGRGHSMTDLWYYGDGETPRGPVSLAELVTALGKMP